MATQSGTVFCQVIILKKLAWAVPKTHSCESDRWCWFD